MKSIYRAGRGPTRSLMLTLAVCICTGGIAHADIEYQFNLNTSNGGSPTNVPVDSFSFSFITTDWVAATPCFDFGDCTVSPFALPCVPVFDVHGYPDGFAQVPFPAFNVTDGTHSWTINEGGSASLTTLPDGEGCFVFGDSSQPYSPFGCEPFNLTGVPVSKDIGSFFLRMVGSGAALLFPTAPGTYSVSGGGDFYFPITDYLRTVADANGDDATDMTGTLTISEVSRVPEPASILLLASILGVVGWKVKRRRA